MLYGDAVVRTTEKTSAVLGESQEQKAAEQSPPNRTLSPASSGHGRNRAEAFVGARKVAIAHQSLKHGDRCPECGKGNIYGQKEPKALVRIVGQAPLEIDEKLEPLCRSSWTMA